MGMNMPCEGCGHTIGHSATCPSRAIIGKGTPKTPYEEIRNSIQGGQAECGVPEGVLDKRKLEREVDFVGLQLVGDADGEFLFVNPEWVMAFGKDEDGLVAVVLHDGQSMKVKHSVEELVELFKR